MKLREPRPIPLCPTAGEGCHNWLMECAWALRLNGEDAAAAGRYLAEHMTRRPEPREIEQAVAKVFACAEPADVAAILGQHVQTIWAWCRSGKMPHIRLSARNFRIRQSDLDQFLADRTR